MKVTLIADSTFIFEHRGIRLLTDPWIGTTIYGGAWRQFPPPVIAPENVGRLDYIFISHIHEDHCDPKTIAALDRNATVLLMDHKPNFVENFLGRHNFKFRAIRKIAPYTPTAISPDFAVEMIDADPAHALNHLIDSSLLLHWDRKTIYFANDNPPYSRSYAHLKQYRFALAALPASGGSGYPACYTNLLDEEKAREKQRIVQQYFQNFVGALAALQPERFMASAGNHVVVGRGAALNRQMTYLESPMAAYRYAYQHLDPEIRTHVAPLHIPEGGSWDLDAGRAYDAAAAWTDAMKEGDWPERKRRFVADSMPQSPYDHDLIVVPDNLNWGQLFECAGEALLRSAAKAGIRFNSNIYIDLPSAPLPSVGHIDGGRQRVEVADASIARCEPYLEVSADRNLMYQMLIGAFSWNIADAAGFLRYRRVPNVYDQQAVIALNFLRSHIEAEV